MTNNNIADNAHRDSGPRPCPFCGESRIRTVSEVIGHGSSLAGLECRSCQASVYDDYDVVTGKTALEKWNRGRQ